MFQLRATTPRRATTPNFFVVSVNVPTYIALAHVYNTIIYLLKAVIEGKFLQRASKKKKKNNVIGRPSGTA